MRVYIAGPISGKSFDEVQKYYNEAAVKLLRMGYHPLHALIGKDHLRNEAKFRKKDYRHPVATNHAIYERDHWMTEQCDILFVDFSSATDVSIGTCFELAWASRLRKHTVGVLPEDNPHQHAFVIEALDVVFETSEDAYRYLEALGGRKTYE